MARDVRAASVAGSWYPSAPDQLARDVDRYVADADVAPVPPPRAIVVPHAGLVYSGPVAAYGFRAAAAGRYAAVVLVGPSHFVPFEGVSIWARGAWQMPFGPVTIAETLAAAIVKTCAEVGEYPVAHGREHSLELQLPFLGRLLPGVPIVPLVMGRQTRNTAFALGDALATVIADGGDDVLLIASSDLSHYHEAVIARTMDEVVVRHVERLDTDGLMGDLEREPGHACGGGPIVSVMHAARRLGATRARVLRYADSGDINGDKSQVVGYMAAAIW